MARQAAGLRQRRDELGPGISQIFHGFRANPARQHVLDLSDLAVHHLQPQGDDQRPITLLHHAVETSLAGAYIDGIDAEARRQFGRAHPEPFRSDLESCAVLSELDVAVQRQAGRIMANQCGEIVIDDTGHAGPVAGGRDAAANWGGRCGSSEDECSGDGEPVTM